MKETAKEKIIKRLASANKPLAVHELLIPGVSDNAAATRLSELAKEGAVVGNVRPGKNFKQWSLVFKLELA